MNNYFVIALGVFFCNWIIIPVITKSYKFFDGFYIGLIGFGLVLFFNKIIEVYK